MRVHHVTGFVRVSAVMGALVGCDSIEPSANEADSRDAEPQIRNIEVDAPLTDPSVTQTSDEQTPVNDNEDAPIDFDSFESYGSLSDADKDAVRDCVAVLLAVDPVWRRLEADLEMVDDNHGLAAAINRYCDGVEQWMPRFKEHHGRYPQVVAGGELDLLVQEMCASVMADPETIMGNLNEQISRSGADPEVAEALNRLDDTLASFAD